MSQPYQCPKCSYSTAFGNAATITMHERVSHGGHASIAEAREPIHEVGSIDWYGGVKVRIIADTGRQVTMLVLATHDRYFAGETVIRNY